MMHTEGVRFSHLVSGVLRRLWLGWQAFYYMSGFNVNIASWNVQRVTDYTRAFDVWPSTSGLDACIKRGMYDKWGSTLQKTYPTWSSLCAPPTPTPRYACPSCCARVSACKRG